ncbi:MAG: bifunctional 2-polyprenyl-6-hydroxyphenol methylase/3-demethylubiquinol 3-O-methyltransferase UbiG [Methylococcales bacterium]|nr:bifunctional 2-polyprenyl-6-hydroxyphenol methylase/3-demethylubiquinol 3-O-methyltransferase UbiG [Methylococcales bacterium]
MSNNVHSHEIDKFSAKAERWWDPEGELKTLHAINPLRMDFIQRHVTLTGTHALDVGCGGGILTEALAAAGSQARGIDLSAELVDIAELHGLESGVNAHFQVISAETFAEQQPAAFDVVTCMEMLEHVPDPNAIIAACAQAAKPGAWLFFSTLNRHPKAFLLAIAAAEYLLQMLPRGTHDYRQFIKPSQLCQWARAHGLELERMAGISYNPLTRQFRLSEDLDVNYLAAFRKPL